MKIERFKGALLSTLVIASLMASAISIPPIIADTPKTILSQPGANSSPGNVNSDSYLSTVIMENVNILENGSSRLTLLIDVPPSPLAEMYRKSLGASPSLHGEIITPDNKIEKVAIGENVTENVMHVGEEFYNSIEQEQLCLLGFAAKIFESKVLGGDDGGFRISLSANAVPHVVNTTKFDQGERWEIVVGPVNDNASSRVAGFVSTKIAFIHQMLESLAGEQIYESFWSTKIELPNGAKLLNGEELDGQNWTIDFGGGTYIRASISLENESTIILNERTVATEQNNIAMPENLDEAFKGFKTFKIKYSLSSSMPTKSTISSIEEADGNNNDWSRDWKLLLFQTRSFSLDFHYENEDGPLKTSLDASLIITPTLELQGHIAWDPNNLFEAWIEISPSIKVDFSASATGAITHDFLGENGLKLFKWETSYFFWVGWVPVWTDLQFDATCHLEFTAEGVLTITAGVEIGGSLKIGFVWKDGNLELINEPHYYFDNWGPIFDGQFVISIKPSIEFKVELLFYKLGGPFFVFEPYILVKIRPFDDNWEFIPSIRIAAGIEFSDWLKEFLPKDWTTRWEKEIFNKPIDELYRTGTLSALIDKPPPIEFFIALFPENKLYRAGDVAEADVKVTNTGKDKQTFWLKVTFKDPSGHHYDAQTIMPSPSEVTLSPGENRTFSVSWKIPPDAQFGTYMVDVDCWKTEEYGESFKDSLESTFIFYVYNHELNFLTPRTSKPAMAGDNSSPDNIFVSVKLIPSFFLDNLPTFSVEIGGRPVASYDNIDMIMNCFGIYTLRVTPPAQPSQDNYDIKITATFAQITDSKTEENAVEYGLIPKPVERPIDKGLAWLRSKQQSDNSWCQDVGITSLAVLAFLNEGYDERSDYTVRGAIQYITGKAQADGSIYNDYNVRTYQTSLAIIALEATHNDAHRGYIEKAKKWLVASQWDENCLWGGVNKNDWYYGGFGYGRNIRPDLSNTQFALLALDAAGLPKDDPLWVKVRIFLARCQNINENVTENIDGVPYTVPPSPPHEGGYDNGFIYTPYSGAISGTRSYGSMTAAGIWGLLLSGVDLHDNRVKGALNWVRNNYTWGGNTPFGSYGQYYYYLSMSKALTLTGLHLIDGHDWYQELWDNLVSLQHLVGENGYWVNPNSWAWEGIPELTTAYSILSLQTRRIAEENKPLSYLIFILRSSSVMTLYDSEGRHVGLDYKTGIAANQIPNTAYIGPFMEPQYIVIVNPGAETYKLELLGTSDGPFKLEILGYYGEDEVSSHSYSGNISMGSVLESEIIISAIVGPITVYSTPPVVLPPEIELKTWVTGSNFENIENFGIVFTPVKTDFYALTATNPGQFYHNILVNNIGGSPTDVTITYAIDENFSLKGARPIHVYSDLARTIDITENCTFSDNTIIVEDVPPGAIVYATIHLDFALKKTIWPKSQAEAWYSEHTFQATANGIPSSVTIGARAFVPTRKVSIQTIPSYKSGKPCTTLTYMLIVWNRGDVVENYALSVSDNAGWDPTLSSYLLENVKPGRVRVVTLSVRVPEGATYCTRDIITVVVSPRADRCVGSIATCQAHVYFPIREVSIQIFPSYKSGSPCTTLTYTLMIMNKGNVVDNYSLSVRDNSGWAPTLSTYLLKDVRPCGFRFITLSVHVPEGATYCTRDNITVVVSSQADPSVSSSASCIAHVSSPV